VTKEKEIISKRRELCSEDQQRKRKGYQKGAILLILSSNG